METTTVCIIICVVHFLSAIVLLSEEISPILYWVAKFFFYSTTILAVGIMLYFLYCKLETKPIMLMVGYMVIPGGFSLIANLFALDQGDNKIVPGTLITMFGMMGSFLVVILS